MRRDEASRVEAAPGDGGFVQTIVSDGVLLLLATAGSLVLAGGFAIFLAASGEFLPHDIAYLGMSAADLCTIADCRIGASWSTTGPRSAVRWPRWACCTPT
jgi:hypothetical protein